MSIRLLIADDHEVVRAGLKSLLAEATDIHVVAEAINGEEAVRLAHRQLHAQLNRFYRRRFGSARDRRVQGSDRTGAVAG